LKLKNKISENRAMEIVAKEKNISVKDLKRCLNYKNLGDLMTNPENKECWGFFAPWNDGLDGKVNGIMVLRSSRLILVEKNGGKIIYDGSAFDEG